jgi:hypothetical protein
MPRAARLESSVSRLYDAGRGIGMHIMIVVIGGFAALAAFYFGYRFAGLNAAAGAALFIWVWLAASVLNGFIGVYRAGIPVINEIGAFILIFGIPAAAAWYLAYRYGVAR